MPGHPEKLSNRKYSLSDCTHQTPELPDLGRVPKTQAQLNLHSEGFLSAELERLRLRSGAASGQPQMVPRVELRRSLERGTASRAKPSG